MSITKPKVYVSRIIADEGLDLLREECEMHVWRERKLMPRDVQLRLFADCSGLLTTTDIKVDGTLLEACPDVKVVSNQAVGYDNVDIAACTAAGSIGAFSRSCPIVLVLSESLVEGLEFFGVFFIQVAP